MEFRDAVSQLRDEELDHCLLNISSEGKVDAIVAKIREPNDVLPKIKKEDCTLCSLRVFFDIVLNVYPTLAARLEVHACIVHSPYFKKGLVRIQDPKKGKLNLPEKRASNGFSCLNQVISIKVNFLIQQLSVL